jgi:putative flippase GtrA
MKILAQAFKYGLVGVINTLLSLVIIWLMTKKAGCSEPFSNFTGYFAGLLNSFFLNRRWTFDSKGKILDSSVKFFIVFAFCYVVQLIVLLLLNKYCPDTPPLYGLFKPALALLKIDSLFYIQMISMAVYTILGFLINKYYTFKR